MKVLFLSEWYPHRYDAMSGLFVRKHAEAVTLQGVDVCVLYLYREERGKNASYEKENTELVSQTTNGVKEVYVYYSGSYLSALIKGWLTVKRQWGIPDICQLNVITKNALLPLWLKLTRHIPYIIIEHWTGYLPSVRQYTGFWHKRLAEATVRLASAVLPVSNDLKQAMLNCGLNHPRYHLINNVVDDFFYSTPAQPHPIFTLLHISCFDEPHKNVKGLLRALRLVAQSRQDFRLVIVGTGVDFDEVYQYSLTLRFPPEMLLWTGEQTPAQVADWFAQSDAFVLFSNYETAGVVLSESLATGTPIISTPVGIAPEIITPDTGILVSIGNENDLATAITHMLDHHADYNRDYLIRQGKDYSYDTVGKQLRSLYEEFRKNK